jgi:dTDP-4-dehydrorhamnose 3,5-epimerase
MEFTFTPLEIPGALLAQHQRFDDARGFILESYREDAFAAAGLPAFVQDNHSRSPKGVLRGLHYQLAPFALGKLVRCARGAIFDVGVDIRRGSPHYGRWVAVELSEANGRMLYLPPGFAHGFCVMSDVADVLYKQTGYYSPAHDRAILWNDADIAIPWPIAAPDLSPRDARAPRLREAENNLPYIP